MDPYRAAPDSAAFCPPFPALCIATELILAVRKNVTIDWTLRESARAKIRVIVRRILRKHGYARPRKLGAGVGGSELD